MNFTFLKATGEVAFFRSDAEQADWTQEEMSLNCTFPYVEEKVIERGMVILFQDPATDEWQAYEVRQCSILPGDGYQQFVAENLAISGLTDCHITDKIELDNISVTEALARVLIGTGWSVGNIGSNPVSSADISRGAVWLAINEISQSWNVHIVPRVTVDTNGISGKYLDILPSSGIDRGLRLAINKNVTDPCVTYDDTDLYTALYGYGGSYTEGEGESRVTKEYDFSSIAWSKTSDHPAKPFGQPYIEYPEMTALFGRNGEPRFGYYQNTSIKDPEILLQKTWESLKECCEPKISITGTVTDLKRLGYADVPLRLYDLAIIELEPAGLLFYKQVIQLTVDLLDPTKNVSTIGDYIPNIIYINRDTENTATGGGKGRGGSGGKTKLDAELEEYRTIVDDNGKTITLVSQKTNVHGDILNQAGMQIDADTGVLVYAEDNVNMVGSKFHVMSDRITSEVNARIAEDSILSSRITQTADAIALEVSERKAGDELLSASIRVTASQIRSEVSDTANGLQSSITQTASQIRSEVRDTANGLSSSITQTASQIRSEVSDSVNGLQSSITQTASQIRSEVSDTANGLTSSITQTASQIRSEVSDTANGLQSSITQTASQIRSEVSETANDLYSSITQTASQIRSEVNDIANGLSSSITQTASQIRSEVRDTANGLNSSITQTASQIRSEVNDAVNGLSSSITQTASQIRSEVTDTANGLQSSITQNANKIALVVEGTGENAKIKPASIVAAINNGASSIKISADHIILDGQAVADSLDSETISVSGLDCGSGTISTFDCDNSFTFEGSSFTFGSYAVEWKSKTIQSFSSSTLHHFTYNDSGTTGSVNGRVITSDSSSTIYYLGR